MVEQDARALEQELLQVVEIVLRDFGIAPERRIRLGHAAFPRAERPAPTRSTISDAMRSSGTIASAWPARATDPGMPHTTLLPSSCTSTCPPAAAMRAAPSSPS